MSTDTVIDNDSASNEHLCVAFLEHRSELLSFVLARVADNELAEDLLQDLYIKIQSLDGRDPIRMPRAFLYRMVNNALIDYLRRRERQSKYVDLHAELEGPDHRGPEHIAEQREELATLKDAVGELPEKCRRAFIACRVEGLPKQQVAAELNVSVNMVEKYLRRALAHCVSRVDAMTQHLNPDKRGGEGNNDAR